nr:novel protein [Danio rerio]
MDSSPHLCLTVRCLEENISAGLPEVISPTRSSTASTCTDTVSLSSMDHEDPERNMQNQLTRTNSCLIVDGKGQNRLFKMHWESNLVVMKYLTNTRSQKLKGHSTRWQLVNIVVSHMKEIHGRIPTCKQRETYALGIISLFPSLRDPFSAKGYIIQDFSLLFNAETSNKLLERWQTAFKHRIINEAKSLTSTARLHCLINSAEGQESENEAFERLVHFHKSCTSIEDHLSERKGHQPCRLRLGRIKGRIDHFYLVMDKHLISCAATRSLSAVDELFKDYVFNLTYEEALVYIFTFLQTTVYNIDVGPTSESPRVKKLRAKLLH